MNLSKEIQPKRLYVKDDFVLSSDRNYRDGRSQNGVSTIYDTKEVNDIICECFAAEEEKDKINEKEDLLQQLKNFSLQTKISYNDFKECDGERCKPREFVSQFDPFVNEWGDKKTLEVIEVKLKGNAKFWYMGTKIDNLINTYQQFKKMFLEMFDSQELDKEIILLEKIVKGFVPEKMFALSTEIYARRNSIEMGLLLIMKTATKNLAPQLKAQILNAANWNDVLKLTQKLDRDYVDSNKRRLQNKVKDIKEKKCYGCKERGHISENCPKKNPQLRTNTYSVKCFNCKKEGHISKNCPEKTEANIIELKIDKIKTETRPCMIGTVNNKEFVALLDTGATRSFISKQLANDLKIKIENKPIMIRTATNSSEGLGIAKLELKINELDEYLKNEFIVTENLTRPMIIGMDTMEELKLTIDLNEGEIIDKRGNRHKFKTSHYVENKENQVCSLIPKDESEIDQRAKNILLKYNMYNREKKTLNIKIDHEIKLYDDNKIIYSRPYRRSPEENEYIRSETERLLEEGIIKKSTSRYASPIVLVKKRDGNIRMCVDYRKLNKLTIQQPYPIPNMDELTDTVAEGKIFTALDMEAGYHQIKIKSSDTHKTAFITRDGLFEFERLPFGLVNAPYSFQRIMNYVFQDMIYKILVVYLDDILIYSKDETEHEKHLEMVIKRCSDFNIRLNIKKCNFFKRKLRYLGFEINDGNINIDETHKKKIEEIKTPKNVSQLRSILGLIIFFKRFIKDFASKISILQDNLKKNNFFIGEK